MHRQVSAPPHQAPGQLAGRLAVLERHGPRLDRGDVPGGLLEQPATARRQVRPDEGCAERESVVVDEVEVTQGAGLHRATVRQAVQACRVVRLLLHDVLEGQGRTAAAVPRPVGEHEGGHGRVADGPGVSAPVGQADQALWVQHHLAHVVEIARGVVEDREVQQALSAVAGHLVVGHLQRRHAACRGQAGERALRPGLVVGRVPEHEGAVVCLLHRRRLGGRRWRPRHDRTPHLGIGQGRAELSGGCTARPQLSVHREIGEQAQGRVVPGEDARGPTRDLGEEACALGAGVE